MRKPKTKLAQNRRVNQSPAHLDEAQQYLELSKAFAGTQFGDHAAERARELRSQVAEPARSVQ
jgi:hypothetical protein